MMTLLTLGKLDSHENGGNVVGRAVNEPDEHERSLVHVRSFNFNRTNKRTRTLKRTNFLVHVRLLKK